MKEVTLGDSKYVLSRTTTENTLSYLSNAGSLTRQMYNPSQSTIGMYYSLDGGYGICTKS
jgi:hypothetical protein